MPAVAVQQYKSTDPPVQLGDEALGSLLTTYRDRIGVAPAIGGGVTLTGGAYVGVISVPELDIFVTPKIAPLSVFWMLAYADRLVKFLPTEIAFAAEDGVLEVLVRLFARQTSLLVRRGLHRDYVERTESIPFIRGRVALLEDARRAVPEPEEHLGDRSKYLVVRDIPSELREPAHGLVMEPAVEPGILQERDATPDERDALGPLDVVPVQSSSDEE